MVKRREAENTFGFRTRQVESNYPFHAASAIPSWRIESGPDSAVITATLVAGVGRGDFGDPRRKTGMKLNDTFARRNPRRTYT